MIKDKNQKNFISNFHQVQKSFQISNFYFFILRSKYYKDTYDELQV